VFGANFVEGDVILWNGSPEPTTFVSDNEVTTGVNMATAEVAIPIPVSVQTPQGDVSNVLTFALGEDLPPLPGLDLPEGWVLLADAYAKPILLRVEEIAGIEEAWETGDSAGPLYGKNPATAYRRLTFRSGAQFFIGKATLNTLATALRE
jgi:hypothetical protein